MQNRRVFCGGTFCFDYREDGYEERAAKDYRAKVLGSIEALLKPKGTDGVKISDGVTYVGPFYFETGYVKGRVSDIYVHRRESKSQAYSKKFLYVADGIRKK